MSFERGRNPSNGQFGSVKTFNNPSEKKHHLKENERKRLAVKD